MDVFVTNIEEETEKNINYRNVIYTDQNIQIVLMGLIEGEDIPLEVHEGTQFIRVEKGKALVIVEEVRYFLDVGDSITIPPNKYHYVRNNSKEMLQLYSIYSPPEHQPGTLQESQP